MLVWIKGAGDIASGVALRLHHAGFSVVMSELAQPTAIRRTVCFSEAIVRGATTVEDVTARFAKDAAETRAVLADGDVAVLSDPETKLLPSLSPDALVDAILAKRNTGTAYADAPAVVALGPGFTAGEDCHAVVETMRGHTLGRVYYSGSALPNTGVPGVIGGFSLERLLRAPCDGIFTGRVQIGDTVQVGDVCALVDGQPILAAIPGVVRGLLPDGISVTAGMKSGDVDPRCRRDHCFTVSDKALAVAGGVLESILHLTTKER